MGAEFHSVPNSNFVVLSLSHSLAQIHMLSWQFCTGRNMLLTHGASENQVRKETNISQDIMLE
jgi:hypothetical protein